MMISLPVLNSVTFLMTCLGLDVMKGQPAQPCLFRPLLHLVKPFLAPSAVDLVLTRRIGGSLALHSNSLMFLPRLYAGLGGLGKILSILRSLATLCL